jgi:predicted transcriptional regulator
MPGWTFITNHGAVLISISCHEMITTREVAIELGITERSVIRIIKDLETDGYIRKHRVGRSNQYQINHDEKLRRKTLRDIAVGDLLKVLLPET